MYTLHLTKLNADILLNTMRVIGIDPGYDRVGIAVLEQSADGKVTLPHSDCFVTNRADAFPERLLAIGAEIETLLETHAPDALAIETLFFNTNQKTAMLVAAVRGAVIYISQKNDVPVFEYSPQEVKIAVTGYGKSAKEQITAMIPRLVPIDKDIRFDDEFDAIAVGLTHLSTTRNT